MAKDRGRAPALLDQAETGSGETAQFAEELLAAYYCAFDRQTPRHVRGMLGAMAYFILPFDFVPDMLPVLGFTDDAAVLATTNRMVATHIRPEHRDAARAAAAGIDRESSISMGPMRERRLWSRRWGNGPRPATQASRATRAIKQRRSWRTAGGGAGSPLPVYGARLSW